MLVLKRKQSESVVLEGGIRVTVLRIRGNAISLGIEAPQEIGIRRGELSTPGTAETQPDANVTTGATPMTLTTA